MLVLMLFVVVFVTAAVVPEQVRQVHLQVQDVAGERGDCGWDASGKEGIVVLIDLSVLLLFVGIVGVGVGFVFVFDLLSLTCCGLLFLDTVGLVDTF